MRLLTLLLLLAGCLICIGPRDAWGQPYGVSGGNNLMPASGGMGGTSVARPQAFLSAVNFNPAALTQYEGTQFTLAGTWAEPTFNIDQSAAIGSIGVSQFNAKSSTPGILAPNIGVFQQTEINGRDMHVGLALISASGLGTNFLHMPQSGGASSYLLVLEVAPSVGFQLTDDLAVGAGVFLGTAFLEGPYIARSAMTNDYALRANVGLAADVLYLMWDTADFWKNQYRNQWILQLGMQYEVNDHFKIRAGYDFAENPIDDNVGTTGSADENAIAKYTQAQFGVINENRFTFGVGAVDVLPGLDFDLFAGGMPRVSHNFGPSTIVNLESYWIGAGLTWRFGDVYTIERR